MSPVIHRPNVASIAYWAPACVINKRRHLIAATLDHPIAGVEYAFMSVRPIDDRIGLVGAYRPARAILARAGDEWTMQIVMALRNGPLRVSELKHGASSIAQRMLMLALRGLERDGLIRRIPTTTPPHVDYELTELGQSLCRPIEALYRWANEHQAAIETAQQNFDQRTEAR